MLGATGAEAARATMRPEGNGPFEFALTGDTPCIASNTPGADYPPFDRVVEEINADPKLKWVLHAGDNEWTDCHRANNGGFQEFPENVRWPRSRRADPPTTPRSPEVFSFVEEIVDDNP